MKPEINDGRRPSRLDIARHATGEAPLLAPERVTPALEALEAERSRTPAFDWTILQAAAHRVEEPRPRRVSRPWLAFFPLFALAVLLLFLKLPPSENRLKGETSLGFYVLRSGQVYPGDPQATFHAGDRIQFTYHSGDASQLVLLSVDGNGQLSTFYPSSGDLPVEVIPGSTHVLPGSIVLDDAPGPEVFLAFFGVDSVQVAEEQARRAWKEGGAPGLLALAEEPDVAVLQLERR